MSDELRLDDADDAPRCSDTYQSQGARDGESPAACLRSDGHKGKHVGWSHHDTSTLADLFGEGERVIEAWGQLWTWGDDRSAHGCARGTDYSRLVPCRECGTPHNPATYAHMGTAPEQCFHCHLWQESAEEYTQGWLTDKDGGKARLIRPHADGGPFANQPYLYCWVENASGGFGNRAYTVRWDDGGSWSGRGRLWSSGLIPWWLRDQFPPNGTIEDGIR